MKVYIGNYKKWWGPYQIAGLLKYVGANDTAIDKVGDWLYSTGINRISEWFYNRAERTVKVKLHNYDTWNMDSTLPLIIVPMLKQLKETKHGTPISVYGVDWDPEQSEVMDAAAANEWNRILEEMIWAFEQSMSDDWEEKYVIAYDKDAGYKIAGEDFKLPTYDTIGLELHGKRIQDGINLFAKHYRDLWD